MSNKKIIFSIFILIALAQLYVPAKMILNREDVLNSGVEYRFKTAPIDPTDPFRGKYIVLRFENNTVKVDDETAWEYGEEIFASLGTDQDGYAKTIAVSKDEPIDGKDYMKVRIRYVSHDKSNILTVNYPFDRYYMEESKAYDAEVAYRESRRDTNQIAYALVRVKNGEAVLKDVLINGESIKEIVKAKQESQ